MIYSYITGNLGNQMIQYAFARRLMKNRGDCELVINFDRAYTNKEKVEFDYPLEYFNIVDYKKADAPMKIPFLMRFFRFCLGKLKIKNRLEIIAKFGWYQYKRGADYDIISKNAVCICDGNFETTKYLDDVREMLLVEFKPRYALNKEILSWCNKLRNSESICCSVRVWDKEVVNENRIQIAPSFYLQALKNVMECVDDEKDILIYITSNDIEWCKNNLALRDVKVIWDDSDVRVDEKIELMKQCKYFILSNSTFSYMGAYLSENPKKKVFLPKIEGHGLFGGSVPRGMDEENWVLLDKFTGEKIVESGT